MDFFINRFFKDNKFSFLAKSKVINLEIAIIVTSVDTIYASSYVYKHTFKTTLPEIIFVDTPFIEKDKIQKYNYIVYIKDKEIYHGHFQAISHLSENDVKFGFVSCNDNAVIKSNNKKFTKWHSKGVSNEIWLEIQNKNYDIIIHNGDNIYNDSTYAEYESNKSLIDKLNVVKYRISDLFCQTYGDTYQGQCMRQSWNFHQIDDHDVTDCFGTPGTDYVRTNKDFHDFYKVCKSVLDKYLIIDFDLSQINEFEKETFQNFNYTFNINKKYNMIFLDTRESLYFNNVSYSDKMIDYCKKNIDSNKINIIITPRPLFHLSVISSSVIGLIVKDARDSTWHHKQYNQSKKFMETLFECAKKCEIIVVSGDIHETFIQTHSKNNDTSVVKELVTSGVMRSAQNSLNLFVKSGLKIIYKFDRFVNIFTKYKTFDIKNRSFKNNFGELVDNKLCNHTFI